MEHCTILEMHPSEKLPKTKVTLDVEESANRVLNKYLHGDENITEIKNKLYSMGKTTAVKSVIVQKQANYRRKSS